MDKEKNKTLQLSNEHQKMYTGLMGQKLYLEEMNDRLEETKKRLQVEFENLRLKLQLHNYASMNWQEVLKASYAVDPANINIDQQTGIITVIPQQPAPGLKEVPNAEETQTA